MKFVPKLDAKIDFPLFRPEPNWSPRDDDPLVGDDTAEEESQRAGTPAATSGAAAKPAAATPAAAAATASGGACGPQPRPEQRTVAPRVSAAAALGAQLGRTQPEGVDHQPARPQAARPAAAHPPGRPAAGVRSAAELERDAENLPNLPNRKRPAEGVPAGATNKKAKAPATVPEEVVIDDPMGRFRKDMGPGWEMVPYDEALEQKNTTIAHIWNDPVIKWYGGFIATIRKKRGKHASGREICIR